MLNYQRDSASPGFDGRISQDMQYYKEGAARLKRPSSGGPDVWLGSFSLRGIDG